MWGEREMGVDRQQITPAGREPHGQHPHPLGHQDTPDLLFLSSFLRGFLFFIVRPEEMVSYDDL